MSTCPSGKGVMELKLIINVIIDACGTVWLLTEQTQREVGLSHVCVLNVDVLYLHHTIQLTKHTWWTEGRDKSLN